jgi:hypothetical protein
LLGAFPVEGDVDLVLKSVSDFLILDNLSSTFSRCDTYWGSFLFPNQAPQVFYSFFELGTCDPHRFSRPTSSFLECNRYAN